jgi:hypothetical protein
MCPKTVHLRDTFSSPGQYTIYSEQYPKIVSLKMSQVLTFIPQGVAVSAGMAGVACAGFPIPLTVALLLGLLGGQLDLLPVITIGAVTGFVVAKALTPLLPKRAPSAGSGEAKTPAAPAAAGTGEAARTN